MGSVILIGVIADQELQRRRARKVAQVGRQAKPALVAPAE
jgi:hypothetical protein